MVVFGGFEVVFLVILVIMFGGGFMIIFRWFCGNFSNGFWGVFVVNFGDFKGDFVVLLW